MTQYHKVFFSLCTMVLVGLCQAKHLPAKPFDIQEFVDKELAQGKKNIVIPAGRYLVTPKKRTHLSLKGLENVTIDATGVDLVCTETTRAVTITDCHKLTVKGLTIGYDPLPFTQGEITRISEDKLTHTIRLFDGYPKTGKITALKYEIFDPKSRLLKYGSYHGCKVEQLKNGNLKITKPIRWKGQAVEKVGDIITIDCSNSKNGSIPHALGGCRTLRFRNNEV